MACLRLLTFLPELPDFKVPRFILCISRLTALPAFFEYFRPVDLRPVDFLGGMETLLKVVSWWAEGKKKSGKTSVANGGRTFAATDPAGSGEGDFTCCPFRSSPDKACRNRRDMAHSGSVYSP